MYIYLCLGSTRIHISSAFTTHHYLPKILSCSHVHLKTLQVQVQGNGNGNQQHANSNMNMPSRSRLHMSKEPPLTAFLDKFSKTGVDNTSIQRNSLVIAKYDLPELGIHADQTYELQSIYMQGMSEATETDADAGGESKGIIEKIDLPKLDLLDNERSIAVPPGFSLYITLYSSMYHDNDKFGGKAVIVTPQEVGLVSMKDEVVDSVLVALPILSFWLGTCFTFSNWYHDKYGGSFSDALFGR